MNASEKSYTSEDIFDPVCPDMHHNGNPPITPNQQLGTNTMNTYPSNTQQIPSKSVMKVFDSTNLTLHNITEKLSYFYLCEQLQADIFCCHHDHDQPNIRNADIIQLAHNQRLNSVSNIQPAYGDTLRTVIAGMRQNIFLHIEFYSSGTVVLKHEAIHLRHAVVFRYCNIKIGLRLTSNCTLY